MKIRIGYVSNSSSASFVVYNWFDLPKKKRKFIADYDKNALSVWEKNKIPFKREEWRKNKPSFDEGDVYDMSYKNDLPENQQDGIYQKYIPFAFGFLKDEIGYSFEENEHTNTCKISTSMDNFDMEKWLKYNKVEFDELA